MNDVNAGVGGLNEDRVVAAGIGHEHVDSSEWSDSGKCDPAELCLVSEDDTAAGGLQRGLLHPGVVKVVFGEASFEVQPANSKDCLLYTSDAADE